MQGKFSARDTKLDSRTLDVTFSPQVKDAFRSLAVIASRSDAFDTEMAETLKAWSGDKPVTIHEFMTAFPLIAEQMASQISAKRDDAAQEAWRELCVQMPEEGFSVSQSRRRKR